MTHQNTDTPVYMQMEEEKPTALWSELPVPSGLCARITSSIALAHRRGARIRTAVFGILAIASGIALFEIGVYTSSELYASGFYEYASLVFSNSGFVLSSWREFGFLLIESAPSIALLLVATATVATAWFVRRMVPNARAALVRIA